MQSFSVKAQSVSIADSLLFAEDYKNALAEYNKILDSDIQLPTLTKANIYLRKGNCLRLLDKADAALENYFLALKQFELDKADPERIASANKNIGYVYYIKNNLTDAGKYYNKAFTYYNNVKDTANITALLNDIALVEYEAGHYRGSVNLLTKGFSLYKDHMDPEMTFKYYSNLGNAYSKLYITDSTLYCYAKAEETAVNEEDSTALLNICINFGDFYKEKKNYTTALKYLLKGKALQPDYGDTADLVFIYHNLSEVYDSLKDFNNAFYYAKQELLLNEAIYNSEKNKAALELSEKYESDKKDERIKTQVTESKLKTRNLVISLIGLGLVTILGAISFSNYRKKRKANKILEEQNERIEKLNKQLDNSNQVKSKLFSVISHDLRSPISSLYSYLQLQNIETEKSSKASEGVSAQTEQLLETLEDLLVWSKSQLNEFTPVNEKVDLKNLSHQLTKLFTSECEKKKLVIENQINEGVYLHTDLNMLTIIFRNLIANAVKYSPVQTMITINSLVKDDQICYSISNELDNEHQLTENSFNTVLVDSKSSGLGMILIKEFAEKLNATLHHTVSAGRLEIALLFPLT